ncbi:hypothetical protein A3Q56_02276 [Intoshia linei]|uniref:Uncharacterized protein n=1 Tax=Intoshia linei TaxID=1819745 RepID=A0A177B8F6_9BILA|nr:hypothetical protein A3Q56_02276 [Intoshia linei]
MKRKSPRNLDLYINEPAYSDTSMDSTERKIFKRRISNSIMDPIFEISNRLKMKTIDLYDSRNTENYEKNIEKVLPRLKDIAIHDRKPCKCKKSDVLHRFIVSNLDENIKNETWTIMLKNMFNEHAEIVNINIELVTRSGILYLC